MPIKSANDILYLYENNLWSSLGTLTSLEGLRLGDRLKCVYSEATSDGVKEGEVYIIISFFNSNMVQVHLPNSSGYDKHHWVFISRFVKENEFVKIDRFVKENESIKHSNETLDSSKKDPSTTEKICVCSIDQLLQSGCNCGSIFRYKANLSW